MFFLLALNTLVDGSGDSILVSKIVLRAKKLVEDKSNENNG